MYETSFDNLFRTSYECQVIAWPILRHKLWLALLDYVGWRFILRNTWYFPDSIYLHTSFHKYITIFRFKKKIILFYATKVGHCVD